ncbi:MAG: hypothetical protein EU549_04915 [Promethearchaeota archaeon]|nr:MAG: hypothetical protein EU549_04915 [Candidatus Lokiarchaeota archaeon]
MIKIQSSTHFLIGILIQFLVLLFIPSIPWLSVILILIFGFLSHALVDPFAAKFTYHPPEADWNDKFWVSYHVGVYIFTGLIVIFFWQYWLGMIASIIPDILDWGARALRKYKFFHLEWYDKPYVHNFINRPILYLLKGVKGSTSKRTGIIPEIILDTILSIIVILLIYF